MINWFILRFSPSTSIAIRIVSWLKSRDTYRIVRVPYRYDPTVHTITKQRSFAKLTATRTIPWEWGLLHAGLAWLRAFRAPRRPQRFLYGYPRTLWCLHPQPSWRKYTVAPSYNKDTWLPPDANTPNFLEGNTPWLHPITGNDVSLVPTATNGFWVRIVIIIIRFISYIWLWAQRTGGLY